MFKVAPYHLEATQNLPSLLSHPYCHLSLSSIIRVLNMFSEHILRIYHQVYFKEILKDISQKVIK